MNRGTYECLEYPCLLKTLDFENVNAFLLWLKGSILFKKTGNLYVFLFVHWLTKKVMLHEVGFARNWNGRSNIIAMHLKVISVIIIGDSRMRFDISDFAFFCVWTYVKSASSPFAQSFSHAKAQQWSDDILP